MLCLLQFQSYALEIIKILNVKELDVSITNNKGEGYTKYIPLQRLEKMSGICTIIFNLIEYTIEALLERKIQDPSTNQLILLKACETEMLGVIEYCLKKLKLDANEPTISKSILLMNSFNS